MSPPPPISDKVLGTCGLCDNKARLHQSHVIPAFVFRWLRDTSATGHMRHAKNPNKRVQDCEKFPWLCSECEALFNSFETPFATNVFYPYVQNPAIIVNYGAWLSRFCTPISWRVLRHIREETSLSNLTEAHRELAFQASEVWADFLLGRKPSLGRFVQHILPFDAIREHSLPTMPNNMNRYLLRAIDIDVASGKTVAFTYAKMGRFAVFGTIQSGKTKWQGTRVFTDGGRFGPRQYHLPHNLFEFLGDKAKRYAELTAKISDTQFKKIQDELMKNPDRVRNSDAIRAVLEDERLFGTNAVIRETYNQYPD
jgi:hypothetical protein